MHATALALTLAAASTMAAVSPGASLLDDSEHVSKTVRIEPGGTLRVKNFSGRVTITAADRADVSVEATRRGTRSQLDRITLDVHSEGATVVVDANHRESDWSFWAHNTVVETDLDIQVPRRINLDVNVFSAPVTVTGVEGSNTIHGFSSRVKLDDIAGPVRTHTFSGAVEIHERAWQPRQAIDVHTFSGSIDVRVPDSASANVSFRSFSGHLNSEMPLVFSGSTRRRITGRLGPAGPDTGDLRLDTFSGNARIER
jgi:DUF4097 and DUF4098 domain-containing protein YvlB